MNKFKRATLLGLFLLAGLLISVSVSSAQEGDGGLIPAPDTVAPVSIHVEDMGKESSPITFGLNAARGDVELEQASFIVTFAEGTSTQDLANATGGTIVHTYKTFNGASIVMNPENLGALAGVNGVEKIYLDELHQKLTDVGPEFINAQSVWAELGGQQSAGEGVVVGVIDSGIWPEHPSFSDPDPYGKAYDAPPGGPYNCDFGNVAHNPDDDPFTCNNKLIGAYVFLDTYRAITGLTPEEFDSARDDDGHGTHTASTAAGNAGVEATLLGVNRGIVTGVSPRSHIIAYKALGILGGYGSDLVAAIDQATLDGVDVINYSIGSSSNNDPYGDADALAFLNAYAEGVFVATSAGNSGPGANTVGSPANAPWVTAVGASTTDRHFLSTITLTSDTAGPLVVEGASVTAGTGPYSVVMAGGDGQCDVGMPAVPANSIVVCDRGGFARVTKSFNAMNAGAEGMILRNLVLQGLSTDNHYIPSAHVEFDDGNDIAAYVAANTNVMATLTDGVASTVQGDVMAAFSSRGGANYLTTRPDVTAPGVQILAGNTPLGSAQGPGGGGPYGELFQSIQGTSMSSPHVAGAAALLTALHPDWTPGQIKSALMTTAIMDGVTKEDGTTPADPFDYGAGRIDLHKAAYPYLTIDATAQDYIDYKDNLWDLNHPSIFIPSMPGKMTVERTVHNLLNRNKWWSVEAHTPDDLVIDVKPWIKVPKNGDKTFDIEIDASAVPVGEIRHAQIVLRGTQSTVLHIPVTIVREQAGVTLDQECAPTTLGRHETMDCTITMTNNTFGDATVDLTNRLPKQLRLVNGTVVGANQDNNRQLSYNGVIAGQSAPDVGVAIDPAASFAGYFSLADFGGAISIAAGDDTTHLFNVPAFEYAGVTYSQLTIGSNGYVIPGDNPSVVWPSVADLPDASAPGNIIAPIWTDLNPSAGGEVLINLLCAGPECWIVVEWDSVPNFGDGELNTAQVWIGYGGPEDIDFTYGPDISDGDGPGDFLIVGAQNIYGNSGGTTYAHGVGTAPSPSFPNALPGYEVDVFSTPGAPGETYTITYTAKAKRYGHFANCAEMTSPVFAGTSTACVVGEVD